jgi:hypothetical protein
MLLSGNMLQIKKFMKLIDFLFVVLHVINKQATTKKGNSQRLIFFVSEV